MTSSASVLAEANSTPSGADDRAELEGVADLHPGDVGGDALGDLGRQRLDRDLVGDVLEHAALLDAGRLLGALELDRDLGLDLLVELDLEQVEVHEAAADRVALLLLDHDRASASSPRTRGRTARPPWTSTSRTSRSATWNGRASLPPP